MANELKHLTVGTSLTQTEYEAVGGHVFANQAKGDILYASSTSQLSRIGKGAQHTILAMGACCTPGWVASPTITDLTIGGGCISLTVATDIDLIDNTASALSFDTTGKTGIIDIVTTNSSEGVTMSGTLGVTGVLTATGGLAGGAIGIGSSTITTTGLISGGSLDIDDVLINGTTIGHTCDTDLLTLGDATLLAKGTVTVGVDDTGHDVKFFGASAGAYMLYDESADTLEIRGPSADATTSTGKLLLTTALTNINANDVIGSINFQAPAEAGGSDATAIAAGIRAIAQATFTCAVNATDLIFYTGHSEAATEKFRFTSQGEIGIGGANYGSDGQVLTSAGGGVAAAWESLPASSDTTYTTSWVDSSCDAILRLTAGGSGSGCDDLKLVAGTNITLTPSGDCLTIAAASGSGVAACANTTWTGDQIFDHAAENTGGSNYARVTIDNTNEITANTGTTVFASSLHIQELNVVESGGTVTNAQALLIDGAPTEGDNNWAINVVCGHIRAQKVQFAVGAVCALPIYFENDTNTGLYRACVDAIGFTTGGTERMRLKDANLHIGDTDNANVTQGMSINQGAADNHIFALKSSDIAHGITGDAETDTFGWFGKVNPTVGGLLIKGLNETGCFVAIQMNAIVTDEKTTVDSNDTGPFTINTYARCGAGTKTQCGDALLFTVHNGSNNAVFHVRGDGNIYADAAFNGCAWDEYCDAQMIRTLSHLAAPDKTVECRWDDFIKYNEDNLVEMGILSSPVSRLNQAGGHGMLNITGLQQLHNGAIWQLHARLETQQEEINALQGQLNALQEGK
jgi:hypothetical protein